MKYSKPDKNFTIIDKDIDYFELGLKCGLEIHQQLDTRKLFCDCETRTHSKEDYIKPGFTITRKLNLSKSELGKVDIAALQESKKSRVNKYFGFHDSSCLVELDEEPPHEVNKEALEIALEVAKFFNMKILDKISFMRKLVIDGSNTSGFQRTGLIALGGELEEKNVGIETLCLEEDACKKIREYTSDDNNLVTVYDLSRLGTPLIEIATAPDIKSPIQAKEVAKYIGMILRSTRKVKRGLGTIRQDVNVSIKNGLRTEIKGAQELDLIPDTVINECLRQKNLIKLFNELDRRGAYPDKPVDLTDLFEKSDSKIIKQALNEKRVVYGLKLVNFTGFLGLEIQPGRRFGTEIAGRIKVLGINGLFHSDELPKYGITKETVKSVNNKLGCSKEDAFILIAQQKEKVLSAMDEIKDYLSDLELKKEVRQALPDGNSAYMRPISNADRMYPETDIPDIEIGNMLDSIPKIKLLNKQLSKIKKKYNIRMSDAKSLLREGIDLEGYVKKYSNLNPKFIVEFLLDYPKELNKRHDLDVNILDCADEILEKLDKDLISKESLFDILKLEAKGKKVDYSNFEKMSISELRDIIKSVIRENADAPENALMGMCMSKLKGKADGKLVKKILKELVQ